MANITKKQLVEKLEAAEAEIAQLNSTIDTARTEYKKLVSEYNAVVSRLNESIRYFHKQRQATTKKAA